MSLLDDLFQDIIKFLLFAAIAIAAFIVSLRNVFWWYCEMQRISPTWRHFSSPQKVTTAATSFQE